MEMNRAEVSVLVIDDVNTIRVQIKDLLISLGFTKVKVVSDGPGAVVLLESETFHLVLCDWHMVPMSGLDILRYVRTLSIKRDVPFIMVTAEVNKDRVVAAIVSGVDSYIMKPITAAQIESKVLEVLTKKGILT